MQFTSRLRNPITASIVAGLATLVARYVDHRINKKPDYLVDYVKAIGFVSGLVFFVVYSISNVRVQTFQQNIMNRPF